jgi:hypothetical protein
MRMGLVQSFKHQIQKKTTKSIINLPNYIGILN